LKVFVVGLSGIFSAVLTTYFLAIGEPRVCFGVLGILFGGAAMQAYSLSENVK